MPVVVGAHDQHAVESPNIPLPPTINGVAELDTGADSTLVSAALLGDTLKCFPVTGRLRMDGAALSTADRAKSDRERNMIALSVRFPALGWRVSISRAGVADELGRGTLVLIGRDVLSLCTLIYDGRNGRFVVEIP